MRHKKNFNPLNKKVSHRHAMLKNMLISLIEHEKITTTKAKAKELRRLVEKMITRAKSISYNEYELIKSKIATNEKISEQEHNIIARMVHNYRIVGKKIRNKGLLTKLFKDIAPRFEKRPGGYTRIIHLGQRRGDASEMVILELVEKI